MASYTATAICEGDHWVIDVPGVGTTRADSVDDIAPRFVRARDTFHPDPVRSGRYRDLFADFLALRQTTATAWPRLDAMRHRAVR